MKKILIPILLTLICSELLTRIIDDNVGVMGISFDLGDRMKIRTSVDDKHPYSLEPEVAIDYFSGSEGYLHREVIFSEFNELERATVVDSDAEMENLKLVAKSSIFCFCHGQKY